MKIADIHTTTASLPPRLLIHGTEGTGKTTLAARFPGAVFLQCEDGTPGGLQLQSFGLLDDYGQVREALAALAGEPHNFKTIVVDSLDKLEGLIWREVCAANNWPSIESPGYGKGYVVADRWWRDFIAALDWLRRERGMAVVLIGHSAVEMIADPRAPSYASYQLRLHKRARGLIQGEVDAIAFLATDVVVLTEEQGFNKKRNRADGGSQRWLNFEGKPAFLAKSRFNLPAKMLCSRDFDVSTLLAAMFPSVAPGVKAQPNPNEANHE